LVSRPVLLAAVVAAILLVSLAGVFVLKPQTNGSGSQPNPLPDFGKQTSMVTVGSAPYGVACALTGGDCYVAVSGADEVAVINNQSQVVGNISLGGAADFLALDPASSLLYAELVGNNSVAIINTTTSAVTSTVAVGAGPGWLAFDPASGTIYVVNRESNSVSVISGESVVDTISLTGLPFAVAYDLFDGNMYVTDNAGTVFVINGATNSLVRSIQVAGSSSDLLGIAYGASDQLMYVTSNSDGAVYTMNSTQVIGMISGFDAPTGIAFNLGSAEMFVVNSGNGTVSALWNGSFSTVSVGSSPREVVFDPSTTSILVTNYGGTTVSVVGT
jgi:YVTN family beta-propeller protein